MSRRCPALVVLLLAALVVGGGAEEETPVVVVASSLLDCALQEVTSGVPVEIVNVLPPGSCPGHFDLPPSFLSACRRAGLVVMHQFQAELARKIRRIAGTDLPVFFVTLEGSLLIPDNYRQLLRMLQEQAGVVLPRHATLLAENRQAAEERLDALAADLQKQVQPCAGRRVIASEHQAGFCRHFGLEVVGVFRRPEDVTPAELGRLADLEADLVVGNLQEGTQAATALGERKGLPVVIFSNFPGAPGYGTDYYDLLVENLRRLERTCRKHSSDFAR
jgi:ABC-type Zn uptake system ZnuABC Zn-binding protein ZnuA